MKAAVRTITPPFSRSVVLSLRAGDEVLLTGTMYTARDAAHKRLIGLIDKGHKLPVDLRGQILYYTGPTPVHPVTKRFSAGPTTSSRMDACTPTLLEKTGLAAMIGKGDRGPAVIEAMRKSCALYFAAGGGLGALLGKCVKRSVLVCWEDLGPEAMYRFEVHEMPLIVAIDCHGGNLYLQGPAVYSRAK